MSYHHYYFLYIYVNSLVEKLRGAGVGVEYKGQIVTTLFYADAAVLLAENEEQVKRGLKVLEEWCKEWAVEVNVERSGVMHMRRRCEANWRDFSVDDEKIEVVEEYKY